MNSGCNIEIKNGRVYKTSGGLCKLERLTKQINKQLTFKTTNKICTPELIDVTYGMQYIDGIRADKFVTENSYESILRYFNPLLDMIKDNLSASSKIFVSSSIFAGKLFDIKEKTNIDLLSKLDRYFGWDISIPAGACHGDLTLSNMIWSDKIYLFDFLDNIVETPLWDISKLRQDIKYGWFTRNSQIDFKKLQKLNALIEEKFIEYTAYFNLFDFMVLARILPYVDKNDRDWILRTLEKIDV